ncbi:MFS transporter [Nocardia sp. NPDC052566]|uniref:MFS transporter n=1 Tax=Nocardia sp. NPDC052566 TaxID=3364330 RepID=UPI0037C809CC
MSSIDAPGRTAHEKRITTALFAAGLTTFASMYSAQALLPSLSAAFGATPARAALAVSLTTGFLALTIVPIGVLSGRIGRTRVMTVSAILTAVIGLLLPFSPSLDVLLAGRAVQGVALAGIPAVSMAYLAEEVGAAGLGTAMGIYVAGNSIGGLAGRLLPAFLLDAVSWRWAQAAVAVAAALCTIWFVRTLPPSRRFVAQPAGIRSVRGELAVHLSHRRLLALFGLAFVLVGGFVSLYNFLGYRLIHSPFGLSSATAGLVFVLYLAGTVASPTAGRLADRLGHIRVLAAAVATMALGLLVSLPDLLPTVVLGQLLCTAGFFGAHTVAGSWIGAIAPNRGTGSSLYLFAFYAGSAIFGGAAGIAYAWHGWAALAGYVGILLVVATALVTALAVGVRRDAPAGSLSPAPV